MSALRTHTQYCLSCCHSGYCQVKWGIDCKRQGGSKTPRMKSITVEIGSPKSRHKPKELKKQTVMAQPIRTKAVNWG